MRLVRQKVKLTANLSEAGACESGRGRSPGGHRPACAVLAALLIVAAGSGCASEADGRAGADVEHRARPAAGLPGGPGFPGGPGQKAGPERPAGQGRAPAGPYENAKFGPAVRAALAKKWRLDRPPLIAPPPPAVKPHITTREGFEVKGGDDSLPPVFTTVPTKDRVVFLTMDDGSEKDPELLQMMDELDIPYSAFLTDDEVRDNYGYFGEAQRLGVGLNNHTLSHPYLPGLSYSEQKREICDQQATIEKQYGKRPVLFRPPYGNYNGDTLRIAKSCGVKAVPLWNAEAFPDHMEWREGDQDLRPGDIILTHFRGRGAWGADMADLVRAVMKTITDQGYAVARLEDYV
ncbi:polysaccharide deacetylase family protein [Streptomyces sp. NBC_01221]|uniref:polysaccharide deacetylase family protein n=1 Tax=unclassified Streptomyces TaxID=2593676 RepID=UPI00225B1A15|nr:MULTISPECIES: polysaccharide deacetylase family protein [unclassified Streptomyces]WSP56964.1 polysaccharide deacetylase family protein [Streptomyces sp. NBC_01241]WSU22319.1 polysaccharide deacetylase family protein [Streptomyces sp. NBC_01108]MCX4788752.1 polysaccharide deacetylase family protein [Streptomyces sp. NBC_01221]MCX4795500.1 polysaccharide deacetylase family protein [Streptomyces sp. NBC_01242]WSJ36792.1 polysaccharide deacetylase family protein [Streptomyces sp. NBC_01321]